MIEEEILSRIRSFLKEEGVIIPKGLYSQLLKLSGPGIGALLNYSGKKAGKLAGTYLKGLIGKENPPLEEVVHYVGIFLEEAGVCRSVDFEKQENGLLVKVKGSMFAEGTENKKPICMPLAGALSGVFEEIMGGSWECKELECQAQGKEFCVFELKAK